MAKKTGRKSPIETRARLMAEAEILAKKPDISDIQMVKELKKRGIQTTRQTVHADRQKDLESLTLKDIRQTKSAMLQEIEKLIQIAYNTASGGGKDALRAMDKYNKLFNTKAKVIQMFEQAKLSQKEAEKPIINVTIGKPKEYEDDKDGKNKKSTKADNATDASDK